MIILCSLSFRPVFVDLVNLKLTREVWCLLYSLKTCFVGIPKMRYILANVTLQVEGILVSTSSKVHFWNSFGGLKQSLTGNYKSILLQSFPARHWQLQACHAYRIPLPRSAWTCVSATKRAPRLMMAVYYSICEFQWTITPDSPNLKFLLVCVCACIDNSIILAHETSILSYEWHQYNYIFSSVQSFWYMYYN